MKLSERLMQALSERKITDPLPRYRLDSGTVCYVIGWNPGSKQFAVECNCQWVTMTAAELDCDGTRTFIEPEPRKRVCEVLPVGTRVYHTGLHFFATVTSVNILKDDGITDYWEELHNVEIMPEDER